MGATRIMAVVLAALLLATSCSAVLAYYLVNQLLDDKAPKHDWNGKVTDSTGAVVGGVTVEVRGTVEGDSNVASFKDVTDANGNYSIRYRWNENVQYSVRVTQDSVILAEVDYGTIAEGSRTSNIVIEGAVNVQLSGVVTGPTGQPLNGVLVVGGSAADLDVAPIPFVTSSEQPQYDMTSEAGVYELTGAVSKYGVVCAYHPDYGFAYGYAQDSNQDGSIAVNIQMGQTGTYTVQAQVVDGLGIPLGPQVLQPSRQFRMRLETPFNMSTTVDQVVGAEGMFTGLVGEPSDHHPETVTLTVQATGNNGISSNTMQVTGSTYMITLLNISDDNAATAVVNSPNPLALYQNSIVVVRVN